MRHHLYRRVQAVVRRGRVTAAAMPFLLAACGDGGDAPPQVYNLDAAITQAFAAALQINNLTGQDPLGNTYTLSLQLTPGADAVFEGALRKTVQQTVTVSDGSTTEQETVTMYYVTGPFGQVGAIDSLGSYSVAVRTGDLPTAATVGDSGPLSNDTAYSDSSKGNVLGTAVTTWSLEPASEHSAFACTQSVLQTVGSSLTLAQTTCFQIDSAGTVIGGRVTISFDGLTMVFS